MASSMNFTDKTQESLAAAIQLAKDYANAQGMSLTEYCDRKLVILTTVFAVHPAHIAFVLLSDTQTGEAGGATTGSHPLFASVIDKAGGDIVSSCRLMTRPSLC